MNEANTSGQPTPYMRRVLIAMGAATAVIVLLFLAWQIGRVLLILFASCLVAVFLSGCSRWLSTKTRFGYGWCLLLTILTVSGLVLAAGVFLGTQLWQQADQLYANMVENVQSAGDWLGQFQWGRQLLEQAGGEQGPPVGKWLPQASRLLLSGMGGIGVALVILVIGLYLAAAPELYRAGFLRLVPMARRPRAREVIDAMRRALAGWLFAQFISMAVIGTLVAVGLWLFGIELWLILGLLAGTLTFIPNLGPIIAGVPPVLLALNQSTWLALGVIAYFTAVQMLEGYLVTPLVQQRVIRLPPAAILASQLLMGWTFGLLGVALAAPLLAVVMVAVEMLYIQDLLGDRDLAITGQQNHRTDS